MFRYPENIVLLIIGLIWLIAMWRNVAAQIVKKRQSFASDKMYERIVAHKPTKRPIFKWAMIAMAFIFIAIALMRPVGGLYEEAVFGEGLDLVIALDLSKSMYARDIDGRSRLEIAKAMLRDVVSGLREDRVGLVVFAADAHVQSPLTHDKGTFLTFLDRADPAIMANQGTNIAEAIETSIDRFDMTASQSRAILLLSDGEDPDKERLEAAVKEAADKNIPIFTVGIGSHEGAPIPTGRTWFGDTIYLRHQGRIVHTKLDDESLKHIAEKTNARYFRATDVETARQVVNNLERLPRIVVNSGTRIVRHELYSFAVLIAFLLLLIEWGISERIAYEREKDHWLKRI